MRDAKLEVWGSWRQVDGSTRYAMDEPREAGRDRAALRDDPAMADAIGAAVLAALGSGL